MEASPEESAADTDFFLAEDEDADRILAWIEKELLISAETVPPGSPRSETEGTDIRILFNGTFYIPNPEKDKEALKPVLDWIASRKDRS